MTRYTESFSHFVTSMTAPVASGWSVGRVGLAPTGKAPPYHGAHPYRTFGHLAATSDVEMDLVLAEIGLARSHDNKLGAAARPTNPCYRDLKSDWERLVTDGDDSGNLLFQSEHHPLVPLEFESRESYCLSLIHRKAYSRAAEMADGLDVLDLGCNNGYGTMKIAERCARVIGVDVSGHLIEAAIAAHAGPNIEYRVVDGRSLPFGEKAFDLVTSFQVIEHVEPVEPYLREIRRVLRDTGKAVFTTPNRCIRLEPGMKPWNPFHVREYEAAELGETLRAVFPNVSLEGLFAVPELYKIEHDRVGRAKTAARRGRAARSFRSLRVAARAAVIDGAKAVLPDGLVRLLRTAFAGKPATSPVEDAERAALAEFTARWSLSDLLYQDEDLDRALDLIAICSMSGSAHRRASSDLR